MKPKNKTRLARLKKLLSHIWITEQGGKRVFGLKFSIPLGKRKKPREFPD